MAGLLPTPAMLWYQPATAWGNQGNHVMQPNWQKDYPKTYHQDRPRGGNQHQHGISNSNTAISRSIPVRHQKVTEQLFEELKTVFPEKDQEEKIREVLQNHKTETDLNRLTNYCMSALFP